MSPLARAAVTVVTLGIAATPRFSGASADDTSAARDRLERVRQDPRLASDPVTLDALAVEADRFPPGEVRVEARMLVADAWLGRMHRPADAIAELRKVADDPEADPITSRLAEREIVDALIGEGHLDEAAATALEKANRLDPRFVAHTRKLLLRRSIRLVSLGALGAFAVLAAVALGRAARRGSAGEATQALRRLAPVVLVFTGYIACAGAWLASAYEAGNGTPFLLFGVVTLPLVLLARAWGAVGSPRAPARVLRACVCAASVLAAAFVLLDAYSPTYLEGFGL